MAGTGYQRGGQSCDRAHRQAERQGVAVCSESHFRQRRRSVGLLLKATYKANNYSATYWRSGWRSDS
jgi:hypothetical protein